MLIGFRVARDRALFTERTAVNEPRDALPDRQPTLGMLLRDRLVAALFESALLALLDAVNFSRYMAERKLAGIAFEPVTFTPKSSTLAGKECGGVRLKILDRDAVDSPAATRPVLR